MERPDYRELTGILEAMNKEGKYKASVLARDDGFTMAFATSPGTDKDIVAAMSGYITSSVDRVRKELGLGEIRDISVRCSLGKAVFKKISSGKSQPILLAAVMDRNVRYHSRALGKAATRIRRLLSYKGQ